MIFPPFASMHHRNDTPSLFTLIRFARQNRTQPTRSEALLWDALRRWQLGPRFRRQHPIGGCFIVDFCCTTRRLVVEVDGAIHRNEAHRGHDARRQRIIESLGYRVVRVDAELVEHDVRAAVEIVRAALAR